MHSLLCVFISQYSNKVDFISMSEAQMGPKVEGRGVYPKGVGRAISHIFYRGVWRIGHLDYIFFDRLVSCCISIPVMPIVNRDYLKLVLPYVYVNST